MFSHKFPQTTKHIIHNQTWGYSDDVWREHFNYLPWFKSQEEEDELSVVTGDVTTITKLTWHAWIYKQAGVNHWHPDVLINHSLLSLTKGPQNNWHVSVCELELHSPIHKVEAQNQIQLHEVYHCIGILQFFSLWISVLVLNQILCMSHLLLTLKSTPYVLDMNGASGGQVLFFYFHPTTPSSL